MAFKLSGISDGIGFYNQAITKVKSFNRPLDGINMYPLVQFNYEWVNKIYGSSLQGHFPSLMKKRSNFLPLRSSFLSFKTKVFSRTR